MINIVYIRYYLIRQEKWRTIENFLTIVEQTQRYSISVTSCTSFRIAAIGVEMFASEPSPRNSVSLQRGVQTVDNEIARIEISFYRPRMQADGKQKESICIRFRTQRSAHNFSFRSSQVQLGWKLANLSLISALLHPSALNFSKDTCVLYECPDFDLRRSEQSYSAYDYYSSYAMPRRKELNNYFLYWKETCIAIEWKFWAIRSSLIIR